MMNNTEPNALSKQQANLQKEIAAGQYETLVRAIANQLDQLARKVSKRKQPAPFWFTLLILYGLIFAAGSTIALIRNEFFISPEIGLLRLSLSGFILSFMLTVEVYIGLLLKTTHDHIVPDIEASTDLADFRQRMAFAFSRRYQILFGLFFAVITTLVAIFGLNPALQPDQPEFGFVVTAFLLNFLAGSYFYFMLHLPALVQISQYDFNVYDQDPANSELIDHLGDALNLGLYLVGIGAAIITFILTSFNVFNLLSNIIVAIFIWWGPTFIFFVTNQYVLGQIIKRAKWQTLNDIQAKIKALHTEKDLTEKDSVEAINRLMDYHTRIKETNNSPINLRARLGLLNSLFLPLLGSLLGNLENLLGFF